MRWDEMTWDGGWDEMVDEIMVDKKMIDQMKMRWEMMVDERWLMRSDGKWDERWDMRWEMMVRDEMLVEIKY